MVKFYGKSNGDSLDALKRCNSIAIQNFKRNFDFSATKRCLALTSNLWTLKIGTHAVQRVLNRYNAAIFDITLTA